MSGSDKTVSTVVGKKIRRFIAASATTAATIITTTAITTTTITTTIITIINSNIYVLYI